ncbi:MAG: phosphatase PAP2 family protein [Frankiales bacterium]|nr:phosphatase PAP2 family protein [Frankiales bacterium]
MRTPRGYASVEVMPALSRRAAALAAACTALFVGLTVAVAVGGFDGIDETTFRHLHGHHADWVVTACRWFTDVFSPLADLGVLAVVGVLVARHRSDRRPLLAAASGAALLAVTVLAVKHGMGRPPPTLFPDRPAVESALSYPSGHTASVLVCYGLVAQLLSRRGTPRRRRLLAGTGVLTVLVAAALVYAGYHWLSDTIGAIPLGIAILATLRATQFTKRATTGTSLADTLRP